MLQGEGFAQPNPRPMFPNPPGLLRVEPHSEGLRDRIWWGAGYQRHGGVGREARDEPAELDAEVRRERTSRSTSSRPSRSAPFRAAWKEAGHTREPRVSVSRSIFALVDDRDRAYFGRSDERRSVRLHRAPNTRAIFGRSYAAEPDVLIEQLKGDEAIAEADTLLLTVPNQLGVDYNAHVIEAILTHVAPALGWR